MGNLVVKYYSSQYKNLWDTFVKHSNQNSFLFLRDFMTYHSHKFTDASLIIFKNEKPVALFPANRVNNAIFSHQGLTYGGLIFTSDLSFKKTLECYKAMLQFYWQKKIEILHIKTIPNFYIDKANLPSDYLFQILKAKQYRCDILSVLNPKKKHYSKDRLQGYKRGVKHQLKIKEVDDFSEFWNTILLPNLRIKHNVLPVHTLEEIHFLKNKFKNNIRQFNVYYNNDIVGGTTIFETKNVAHSQYISATNNKNKLGSLDYLHFHLLEHVFAEKPFFDFGTSNINQGRQINLGLLYWKEGFGARSVTQPFYSIKTKNFKLLDTIFV